MKKATQSLVEKFQETIDEMPPKFTSHWFIQRLAQRNQKLYIEALHEYRTTVAPFRALHVEIAHQLKNFKLEERSEVDSVDIFGDPTPCMEWRKI